MKALNIDRLYILIFSDGPLNKTQLGLMVALYVFCGFVGSWSWVLVPAFLIGFLRSKCPRIHLWNSSAATCAWLGTAFVQDASSRFRISMRIAGVMGLNLGLYSYLITGLIAALLSYFASAAGSNLALILQQYWLNRFAANTQGD